MNNRSPMDEATKARLFAALSAKLEERLHANEDIVSEERDAAQVGDGSQHSVDDLSQSDEEGELSGLHEGFANRIRETLARSRRSTAIHLQP